MSNHSTTAAHSSDAIGDLDAFITKALKEYQVPGAAVAVVRRPTRGAWHIHARTFDRGTRAALAADIDASD